MFGKTIKTIHQTQLYAPQTKYNQYSPDIDTTNR